MYMFRTARVHIQEDSLYMQFFYGKFSYIYVSSASLLMSTLFSLGGLPTHPQNPHSWTTSLSLLRPVRLGRPYQEHKVPAGIARKVIETCKAPPHHHNKVATPETSPQLQTSRKERSWTPQETMAMRRCRNRSNDLINGGR